MSLITSTMKTSRASLSLNNMAVTMMEQGQHKNALKTLMDSIDVMKLSMSVEATTTTLACNAAQQVLDFAVEKRLSMASKKLACCCQKKNEPASSAKNTMMTEIASVDDGDIAMMKYAGNYASSSSIAFPIRMRNSTDEFGDDNDCLNMQAAIISYNRGLVCLLAFEQQLRDGQLSQMSSSIPPWKSKLLVGAFKFLTSAHAMMAEYIKSREEQHQDCEQRQHQQLRAMLVIRLVLGKLFQVLKHQGRPEQQIQSVIDSFTRLDDAVEQFESALLGPIFSNTSHSNLEPTIAAAA